MIRYLAMAASGLAALVALVVLTPDGGEAAGPAGPVDIAAGASLYAENCASCHGANLEGQADWRSPGPDGRLPAPPHDETGHTWHHGDGLLFAYTKNGGAAAMADAGIGDFDSGMPGFGDTLTDQEIYDIIAFIKSTWSERARDAQAERTRTETMGNPS